jgi:cytochrome c peroxidase
MIRIVLPRPIYCAALVALLFSAPLLSPVAAFEPITTIPSQIDYNLDKALLGRTLFSDRILSLDRSVSCASCHDLASGGSDHEPLSAGVRGQHGLMNAPTVFNAVFNFRQSWNGRDPGLREQADGPIHNPVEMRMTTVEVERRLNADARYRRDFSRIYGKDIVAYNDVLDAIAEFEKSLVTPDSRFDRYLRGELNLTDEEKKGYQTFKELGCITCHNGVNVGGNSFQKVGVLNQFPSNGRQTDRFKVTGKDFDKNVYKVPTLRNIANTAPYFHDGSKKTLQESLAAMSFYNLGLELTSEEVRTLIAFLNSLTGSRPGILAETPR